MATERDLQCRSAHTRNPITKHTALVPRISVAVLPRPHRVDDAPSLTSHQLGAVKVVSSETNRGLTGGVILLIALDLTFSGPTRRAPATIVGDEG